MQGCARLLARDRPFVAQDMAAVDTCGADFSSGNLAVVITADEDDTNSGNVVLTTVLQKSLDGMHRVVSSPPTHYSLTRFYDRIAGTAPLRAASTASNLGSAFGLQ
jgi:phosphatidylinositol-3-phosphatase